MPNTAQQTYSMQERAAVWQVAVQWRIALGRAGAPYAVSGTMADCLYGYHRAADHLEFVVRPQDKDSIHATLREAGFAWDDEIGEYRSPMGIPVQMLMAGEPAGIGAAVRLPNPADNHGIDLIEGLRVLSLSRLISVKIARGEADRRRRLCEFTAIIALMKEYDLDWHFTKRLYKPVRPMFRRLVRQVVNEYSRPDADVVGF